MKPRRNTALTNRTFEFLKKSESPDRILSNFVRIIKQADLPSIWYSELRDETFFNLFMDLCEYSQYSVDLFAEDNELKEFILNKKEWRNFLEKNSTKGTKGSIIITHTNGKQYKWTSENLMDNDGKSWGRMATVKEIGKNRRKEDK